jgi:predicted transcriptional regulator
MITAALDRLVLPWYIAHDTMLHSGNGERGTLMAAKGGFKVLGDLERVIMRMLWQDGYGTVRDVFRQIRAERPIALTTVMTTMVVLAKKGLLAQEKGAHNAYVYTPVVTKDELMLLAVQRMFADLRATPCEQQRLLQAFSTVLLETR